MSHCNTIPIALAAALILTGCGNTVTEVSETPDANEHGVSVGTNAAVQSVHAKGGEKTESETETAETYGVTNYGYTGYQDACKGWAEHERFVGKDYDNDGRIDRVYKEYREDEDESHYRIEFGNGDVIDMDQGVDDSCLMKIESADLNGDGQNEITVSFTAVMSTDMRAFGKLAVYEKRDHAYEEAVLPFHENTYGYSYGYLVPIRYEKVHDKLIKVTVEDDGFETLVPVDDYEWNTLAYGDYFSDDVLESSVWDSYVLEADGKSQLVCKVHIFDKWSSCGLFAVLSYENGKYVVDRWICTNDEFSDEPVSESSRWHLEDYLLCSHTVKAGRVVIHEHLRNVHHRGER